MSIYYEYKYSLSGYLRISLGFGVRNDDKIKSTILLVLFHFFGVAKPLNRLAIRSFGSLKKRKITAQYSRLYFINVPNQSPCFPEFSFKAPPFMLRNTAFKRPGNEVNELYEPGNRSIIYVNGVFGPFHPVD